jgi:hypothetical protein
MLPMPAWTVPAYYDLAQAENRVLVEWLLPLSDFDLLSWLLRLFGLKPPQAPRSRKDVRYLLAEALLDPHVQRDYDLIIIDSPPRLTTSHVQHCVHRPTSSFRPFSIACQGTPWLATSIRWRHTLSDHRGIGHALFAPS